MLDQGIVPTILQLYQLLLDAPARWLGLRLGNDGDCHDQDNHADRNSNAFHRTLLEKRCRDTGTAKRDVP